MAWFIFLVLGLGLTEAKISEQVHIGWTYVMLPFAVAAYYGVRAWTNRERM